jgi:hypothetical protein
MYYKEDRTMFHGFLLPRGPRSSGEGHKGTDGRAIAPRPELTRRFTVRLAEPSDEIALRRLAALDSSRPPRGAVVVGEVAGDIQAALSLNGGRPIANPFVRTAELVTLLELRAQQLREQGVGEPATARVIPLPRRRPGLAGRVA